MISLRSSSRFLGHCGNCRLCGPRSARTSLRFRHTTPAIGTEIPCSFHSRCPCQRTHLSNTRTARTATPRLSLFDPLATSVLRPTIPELKQFLGFLRLWTLDTGLQIILSYLLLKLVDFVEHAINIKQRYIPEVLLDPLAHEEVRPVLG